MGHVLDLVPNHMGIAKSANPWWLDVLENGPSSRFAHFFDIEWQPVKDELADKVLIPILGDQYGEVLEAQELQLAYRDGAFVVRYYDEALPIAPDTYAWIFRPDGRRVARPIIRAPEADELQSILTASRNLPSRSERDAEAIATRAREKEVVKRRLAALAGTQRRRRVARRRERRALINGVAGQPRSFDALDGLLNEQSYRLAHWRVASEEINYRRFFDVNQLAALRMEDPAVFDEVHRFVFELVARGAVTGLRIDHVDGLYAPADYLRRLQERCGAPTQPIRFFVVVEKILGAGEQLPPDWPVHGTTGYEFAAVVNNLFVDRRNERALDDIYRRFVRERRERLSFDDLAYRSKKQVHARDDVGRHQLARPSAESLLGAQPALPRLHALQPDLDAQGSDRLLPGLPHLRHRRRSRSASTIAATSRDAIADAKRRAPAIAGVVFDFIERLLLKQTAATAPEECEARGAVHRQVPADHQPGRRERASRTRRSTCYNRLLSLNEVGADPTALRPRAGRGARLDGGAAASAGRRRCRRPSTHDTKRGEDVRARLNVLSEIPGAWKSAVATMARAEPAASRRDVHGPAGAGCATKSTCFYQTLVGAWPFETRARRAGGVPRSDRRLHDQGDARGEGAHQLAEPRRGVRGGGRSVRPTRSSIAAGRIRSWRRSSRSRRASPSSASTTASRSW